MKTIGVFGTAECRKHAPRLQEMLAGFNVKTAFGTFTHAAQVCAMIHKMKLDSVIITDGALLKSMLDLIPDFRHPRGKSGVELKLSQNNYHGTFVKYEAAWTGASHDCDVLFLNPLQHLVTVAEAPFIFKRFISKITKPNNWLAQPHFNWEILDDSNCDDVRFDALLRDMDGSVLAAVDIETERDCPLRIINCVGYYYLRADGSTHGLVLPIKSMRAVLRMRALNATCVPKVMQGGTYDAVYFLRYGCPLDNWMYDTSNMFHAWYAELPKRLDYITAFSCRYIRYWKDDSTSGGSYEYYQYNARDGWATLCACVSLLNEMPDWARQNYVREFPLNFPCIHMEVDGLAIDKAEFEKQRAIVEARAEASLTKLRKWIHSDFNPRSPDQCKRLLWVLGYRNRDGEVDSSDEMTMKLAGAEHPLTALICEEILEYRGLVKLLSTYMNPDMFWNSRLHSRFNPNGTESGRFSASESSYWCGLNVQTIPSENAWAVKTWIVADEGYELGEGDYSQSEAYCVGYLSGCQSLMDLLNSENDYHSWNASAFFGIPYEEIYDNVAQKQLNKPLRNLSKRVNHGSNYNMTKYMLYLTMGPKNVAEAKRLLKLKESMSMLDVCQYLLDRFVLAYPEVKREWYADIKRVISVTKKLISPLGWTRYFFGDVLKNKNDFNSAVAHGPQNLSVQILNERLMVIFRDMLFGKLRGVIRLKAQIHDSIFYAYRKEHRDWAPEYVRKQMENPVKVRDIKGVQRTMLIPPDMSYGERSWYKLK